MTNVKRSFWTIAIVLTCTFESCPPALWAGDDVPAARLNRPIRVLTINILNYCETSAPYAARMGVLRQQLATLNPDLIAFQEAGYRPGEDHQVKQILAGTGYHVDHECDGTKVNGTMELGIAVASRWPIVRKGCWMLSGSGKALAVEVQVPSPVGKLLFLSTFGTARWQFDRELSRERGAVALDKMIRQTADPNGFPPIIGGDFDATPDAACMRFMTGLQSLEGISTHYYDAWTAAGNQDPGGYTWTTANPYAKKTTETVWHLSEHHRRIDYILIGSPHHYARDARIVSCRVVLNKPISDIWPSDHFGVFAEISGGP